MCFFWEPNNRGNSMLWLQKPSFQYHAEYLTANLTILPKIVQRSKMDTDRKYWTLTQLFPVKLDPVVNISQCSQFLPRLRHDSSWYLHFPNTLDFFEFVVQLFQLCHALS